MSAAVKAAIAARRAANRSQQSSPTKRTPELPPGQGQDGSYLANFSSQLDPSHSSPFGSPKPSPTKRSNREMASHTHSPEQQAQAGLELSQKTVQSLLQKSCKNGRMNLSSRSPTLESIPAELLSLLDDEAPPWFTSDPDPERRPWYEREDLQVLQMGNNEIREIDPRIAQFRGLTRLELHSNRITSLPDSISQLVNLTTLNLSNNGLDSVPASLLALDNLVSLNLSNNKIQTLWDDASVLEARSDRREWEEKVGQQEAGMWAGLVSKVKGGTRDRSNDKRGDENVPFHSLRSLDLSNNRIGNAALGLPDLASRRSNTAANPDLVPIVLPPGLKHLNLSHNHLRGPLLASLFGQLESLEELGLMGSGIADDVFCVDPHEKRQESTPLLFSSLSILDLRRCEIDDLSKIESFFGSSRIRNLADASMIQEQQQQGVEKPTPEAGVAQHQLLRIVNKPSASEIARAEAEAKSGKALCVLLEGNTLREEAFRQKRGGRPLASPTKRPFDQNEPATASSSSPTPRVAPGDRASDAIPLPPQQQPNQAPSPSASVPSTPVKSGPAKEEWELLAEAGLLTEGGRRRLRAEQARKEREAAGTLSSGGTPGPDPSSDENGSSSGGIRGRSGNKTGVNRTGLSDWDGGESVAAPSPRRGRASASRDRGTSTQRSASLATAEIADPSEANDKEKDVGSALANAKLSTKKKEALGQVPCKFFRSNGCSAGNSCPFAHTLPGDGGQKAVCQWYLKGSCRFGHKCALAHVLPGQPMSMDRKNKRAAQQGQPPPQVPVQASQTSAQGHSQMQTMQVQAQEQATGQGQASQSQSQATGQPANRGGHQHTNSGQGVGFLGDAIGSTGSGSGTGPGASRGRLASFGQRDHDFPFGLPDDLQAMSPPSASVVRVSKNENGDIEPGQSSKDGSSSLHRASLLGEVTGQASPAPRPLSVPRGFASGSGPLAMDRGRMSMDSGAAHLGSPPSSRAFGTSPFSHPGGHSVFFSGSQDSEGGAGPFARPGGGAASHDAMFGARSMGRVDDPKARAKWWNSLGGGGNGFEDDEDVDETGSGEDFLPSSLSDLLTPAELERRRRNAREAMHSTDPRAIAQSMPSHALGNQGSLFDLNLRNGRVAIGAERRHAEQGGSTMSHVSAGFLQSEGRGDNNVSSSFDTYPGLIGGESAGLLPSLNSVRNFSGGAEAMMLRESGAGGYSPSTMAALQHHAPGQSLPQGLAAGLSRLHLLPHGLHRNGEIGQQHPFGSPGNSNNSSNHHAGGLGHGPSMIGASGSGMVPVPFPAGSGGPNGLRAQGVGGGGPMSASDYELGPTAPSSFLNHRSPLSLGFSVGRQSSSGNYGSPGAAGSVSNMNVGGGVGGGGGGLGTSPFSPPPSISRRMSGTNLNQSGASSNQFSSTTSEATGIAIPGGATATTSILPTGSPSSKNNMIPRSSSSSHQQPSGSGTAIKMMVGHHHHHPGMHRLRSSISNSGGVVNPSPHSPLALPISTREEDEEDEAIFQLE
ncbi:hypothetical protein IE53DRAFT_366528 [Violaceomyces palustris]|uniref:Uncharacterized protein n=1 Tax=Violaceomyces palustris TaxID=1673888 RepID=A0ACD0P551_9BASI|nr:hypothetical protein IE53DRAFT_366528 [Violaceomyces palustris]